MEYTRIWKSSWTLYRFPLDDLIMKNRIDIYIVIVYLFLIQKNIFRHHTVSLSLCICTCQQSSLSFSARRSTMRSLPIRIYTGKHVKLCYFYISYPCNELAEALLYEYNCIYWNKSSFVVKKWIQYWNFIHMRVQCP